MGTSEERIRQSTGWAVLLTLAIGIIMLAILYLVMAQAKGYDLPEFLPYSLVAGVLILVVILLALLLGIRNRLSKPPSSKPPKA